ncbi:hypothetical protein V490_04993, partial [Pseudogymnoascus sp. VKM F-3557]
MACTSPLALALTLAQLQLTLPSLHREGVRCRWETRTSTSFLRVERVNPSQVMPQPTCPYRLPTDATNGLAAFQSTWSHNPHLSGPFGSPSNNDYFTDVSPIRQGHFDSPIGTPSHLRSHPAHPGSAARYSQGPFNRTPDFASNQQRFQHSGESRIPIPRMPDMDRFHNSSENRQGGSQSARPEPSLAGASIYNSPDELPQRRNEFMQAEMARSQHEAQSNRNPRQPPTLTVQSTFFPTHLPQPNFTSNRSPSYLQGTRVDTFQYSSRSMPGPPPTDPSRRTAQYEQEQRNAWIREANLAAEFPDDSDDDSLDSFNMRLDQRELAIPPHHVRHGISSGHGQRRLAMSSADGEERELAMERSRAARRAAVAAAKLVASPAALASLQQVDLSTLTGDDRNCIICYNEFGIKNPDGNIESAVRLPKCKHIFGDHCLKHWLKDSDSCPYCRDKLPSEPKKSHADEMRRLFSLNRPATASSQINGPMTPEERSAAFAAMESRHLGQHLGQEYINRTQIQSQLHALYALEAQSRARLENAALEQSDAALRDRFNMQHQEAWAALHSHGSTHAPRLVPDHESRRRNRQRANSIRNSTGNNNNSGSSSSSATARFSSPAAHRSVSNPVPSSGPSTTNSNSNSNNSSSSSSRPPAITNRNIFDTSNAVATALGQPRSVTPHPSVLENGGATAPS